MVCKVRLGMIIVAATFAMSLHVSAAQPGFFGDAADSETAAAATAREPLAAGRVVTVDPGAKRVTLEYRAIPEVFLEGGTRSFAVDSSVSLAGLGTGDKVRFNVAREGRAYVVKHIENSN